MTVFVAIIFEVLIFVVGPTFIYDINVAASLIS